MASSRPFAKRGAFILFEGVDRCGKTTQTGLLTSSLSKHLSVGTVVEGIRFPERSSQVGQLINSYLQSATDMSDEAIHLLFSANRWEQSKSIEQRLNDGCHLVCDRYAYSGVAFTSAKGLDLGWCKACDIGLPAPDCIIYLDIPVEDAAKRGNFGEERYEKIDFQKSVREKFMKMKEEDEKCLADTTSSEMNKPPIWHVIDAQKDIESIHQEILSIVLNIIEKCADKPINRMWSSGDATKI